MDGEDEASAGDVVQEREEGDGEVVGWSRVLWFRWVGWCEVVKLWVGFRGFGGLWGFLGLGILWVGWFWDDVLEEREMTR